MNLKVIFWPILLIIPIHLFAQQKDQNIKPFCAQFGLHQYRIKSDPVYQRNIQLMERQILNPSPQQNLLARSADIDLPVVFHVVHNNGTENISDEQVKIGLQHLNDAFANINYYNPETGVPIGVSFSLAQQNPKGGPSTGIERVQSPLTELNYNQQDFDLKRLSRYPSLEYINIWVVREICNNEDCDVAGYAYLPGAHGFSYDGIVIEAQYTGTNPANTSVLVHEMGHYLGLRHTFEGGCFNDDCTQNGDRICDTPPDNTVSWGPCGVVQNSCDTDEDDTSENNPFRPITLGGLGEQPDMHQNYMDYSFIECYDRFTEGQKERMLKVINGTRQSLLGSIGTVEPCPANPISSFTASDTLIEAGESILFSNNSSLASNYEWFLDGNPISTVENLNQQFTSPGRYRIGLRAYSDLENCSFAFTQRIVNVLCPVQVEIDSRDTSLLIGSSFTVSSRSQNAEHFEWVLDGVLIGIGTSVQLDTLQAGFYRLCLKASTPFCSQEECISIQVLDPQAGDPCGISFRKERLESSDELSLLFRRTDDRLFPSEDGGFYLTALHKENPSDPTNPANPTITKLSKEGKVQWVKELRGLREESNISNEIQLKFLKDDGRYLLGFTNLLYGNGGLYLFKYDLQTDQLIWGKLFTPSENRGLRWDDILVNPDSPYYTFIGNWNDRSGAVVLSQIDKNTGNLLQTRVHNKYYDLWLSGSPVSDAIQLGSDIYISGAYKTGLNQSAAQQHTGITKYDQAGSELWSKTYLFDPEDYTVMTPVGFLQHENYLVVAGHYIDYAEGIRPPNRNYIYKTDLEGNLQSAKLIEADGVLKNIFPFKDGFGLIFQSARRAAAGAILVFLDSDFNLLFAEELVTNIGILSFFSLALEDNIIFAGSGVSHTRREETRLIAYNLNGENCFSTLSAPVSIRDFPNPKERINTYDEVALSLSTSPRSHTLYPRNAEVFVQSCTNEGACTTEICDNGIDDDQDGLTDCEDPLCPCEEACGDTYVQKLEDLANFRFSALGKSSDGSLLLGGIDRQAQNALLFKMSTAGELLWSHSLAINGTAGTNFQKIAEDPDGMIYGYIDAYDNSIGKKSIIFRFDPNDRSLLWTQELNVPGGAITDMELFIKDGQYIISTAHPGPTGIQHANVMAIDQSTGTSVWQQSFTTEFAFGIEDLLIIDDFIYLAGFQYDSSNNNHRAAFGCLNASGNLLFAKQFTMEFGGVQDQHFNALQLSENGILASYVFGTGENKLSRIVKMDFAGNLVWSQGYFISGFTGLQLFDIKATAGGFLVNGSAFVEGNNKSSVLLKIDEDGNLLWSRAYTGDQFDGLSNFPVPGGHAIGLENAIYYLNHHFSFENNTPIYENLFFRLKSNGLLDEAYCTEYLITTLEGFLVPVELGNIMDLNLQTTSDLLDDPLPTNTPNTTTPANFSFVCEPDFCCIVDLDLIELEALCVGDSMELQFQICNYGPEDIEGAIPLSIYAGNPLQDSSAQLLDTLYLNDTIFMVDSCIAFSIKVPYAPDSFFVAINNFGNLLPKAAWPRTDFLECDYQNNLQAGFLARPIPSIDLGQDTTICENAAIQLDAGPGFTSYIWSDFSREQQFTAFGPGDYWVQATTDCGITTSDTISISLEEVLQIHVDPSIAYICPLDTAELKVEGFNGYQFDWYLAEQMICEDCTNLRVSPDETTNYTIVATQERGCISADSILVNLLSCDRVLEYQLCEGDSIHVAGKQFGPNITDTIRVALDSVLLVRTFAIAQTEGTYDTLICESDSILFQGSTLFPGDQASFTLQNILGCDSMLNINVIGIPNPSISEIQFLCPGDSLEVFGSIITEVGTYQNTFTSRIGCDSIHTVEVQAASTPQVQVSDALLDCGNDLGQLEALATNPNEINSYRWSTGASGPRLSNLSPGTYGLTVTNQAGCSSELNAQVLDSLPSIQVEALAFPVSCTNLTDGQIEILGIQGGEAPYQISLNGIAQSGLIFDNLAPGVHQLEIKDAQSCQENLELEVLAPPALKVQLPADISLSLGDSIQLKPEVEGRLNTLSSSWTPTDGLSCSDCLQPILQANRSTTYQLEIIDENGCGASARTRVQVVNQRRVFVPNAFSPNGDGQNDEFQFFTGPEVRQIKSFRIFSRWGELLKEQLEVPDAAPWDGTFKGRLLPSGTYIYSIELELINGSNSILNGTVNLIR